MKEINISCLTLSEDSQLGITNPFYATLSQFGTNCFNMVHKKGATNK
jgi:hypothetical protein